MNERDEDAYHFHASAEKTQRGGMKTGGEKCNSPRRGSIARIGGHKLRAHRDFCRDDRERHSERQRVRAGCFRSNAERVRRRRGSSCIGGSASGSKRDFERRREQLRDPNSRRRRNRGPGSPIRVAADYRADRELGDSAQHAIFSRRHPHGSGAVQALKTSTVDRSIRRTTASVPREYETLRSWNTICEHASCAGIAVSVASPYLLGGS